MSALFFCCHKVVTIEESEDWSLHHAVSRLNSDSLTIVKSIIDSKPALISLKNKQGRTPLLLLAIYGSDNEISPQIAIMLIEKAIINQNDVSNEIKRVLSIQDNSGDTALHLATSNGNLSLVRIFLEYGANAKVQNNDGYTPLHMIKEDLRDALKCAQAILKVEANHKILKEVNSKQSTPVYVAMREGYSSVLTEFLKHGSGLNYKDSEENTLLHYAIMCNRIKSEGSFDLVDIISKYKLNNILIMNKNQSGQTPLHVACMLMNTEAISLLLDEEEDLLIVDKQKRTALHYATENGVYKKGSQCAEMLLTTQKLSYDNWKKLLFELEDKNHNTAFMLACINYPPKMIAKMFTRKEHPKQWLDREALSYVYKYAPLSILMFMNNAVVKEVQPPMDLSNMRHNISVDYGLITGYTSNVSQEPETKFLKESFFWPKKVQEEFLLHPLVQLFVFRKLSKLRWIIILETLYQLIFVILFTTHAIHYYSGTQETKETFHVCVLYIVLFCNCLSLVTFFYRLSWKNCIKFLSSTLLEIVAKVIGIIILIITALSENTSEGWKKRYTTAMVLISVYLLTLRKFRMLYDNPGLIVEALKHVLFQVVKILFWCSPLVLGFTFAFAIMFNDISAMNTTFLGTVVKVIVMMTGELDFSETFKNPVKSNNTVIVGDNSQSNTLSLVTYAETMWRLFFYTLFLFGIPIGLFNLLTAFALEKVHELSAKVKVRSTLLKLEYIYQIETHTLRLSEWCGWECLHTRNTFINGAFKLFKFFLLAPNINSIMVTGSNENQPTICKEEVQKCSRKNFFECKFLWEEFKKIYPICFRCIPSELVSKILSLAD